MVSGLVTSPCDQLRIFSGDARLMRIASKSLTGLLRSNGLERYKGSSMGCLRPPQTAPKAAASCQPPVASFFACNVGAFLQVRYDEILEVSCTGNRQLTSGNFTFSRRRRPRPASCRLPP